jgi:uncharacterized phage protein gp47/JayE
MKELTEIYDEMMSQFRAETGLDTTGAVELSVRLYTVAAQLQALYLQSEWVRDQCFPQTAQGDYLDYHAQLRGLTRRTAVRAEGVLRFTVEQPSQVDLTVDRGTVCMTAAQVRFETTQAAVLPAGSLYVDVPARAVEAGEAGNVTGGSIRAMALAPVGVSGCTNPEAFTGGSDEEGDEDLRTRVLETYRRMSNGANAAYYQKEAMSFDQVAAVAVVGRSRGIGTVDVVVSSPQGLPAQELLDQLQAHFEERREIAVDVQVLAPTTQAVTVSVKVQVEEGADFETVSAGVKAALQGWFDGKQLGQDVLLARLGALVFSVEGVANYQITAPTADVAVEATVLPVLQQVTVKEMA